MHVSYAVMATNSIILLLALSISCLCSTRDVYIQPSEGEHCPGTCYNITTFGEMADSFSNSSGLNVYFLEGTHFLDLQELVLFTNLTNAVFKGDGRMEQGFHETVWQSTVVIKCTEHSSTGIAFVNSSNITFRYITITNCGAFVQNSFYRNDRSTYASLGYINVGNIIINHVSIQNGSGSGLLVMSYGIDLIITNSSVAQNVVYGNSSAGSNVFIVYIDPLNCNPQKYVYNMQITGTNVSFGDSNSLLHTGGGLAVFIYQGSYCVSITLDSIIAHDNKGHYGNILIAASENNVPTYNLTINNSLSTKASNGLIIAPLDGTFHKQCSSNLTFDFAMIYIVNSKFTYNKYLAMRLAIVGVTFTSKIIVQSTEICHNIESGVEVFLLSYEQQTQLLVTLKNVIANNNGQKSNDNSIIRYILRAAFVTSLVLNNVSITNNNMTGLSVYRTAVVVNGTSVFHNNTGIDGGGLAMYGDSYLVLKENSFLNFTNNRAKNRGGAIFVASQQYRSPCFFQYSGSGIKFIKISAKVAFFGNTADTAGSVLFGGNIDNCVLFNLFLSNEKCFNETFNYLAQTGPSVISSEPTDVCFCDDNKTINCSQTQLTMKAYLGEEINISVVTVGQRNGVVPGSLHILGNTDTSVNIELHNTSAMNCKTIELTPVEDTYKLKQFGKEKTKMLDIILLRCPLGFMITNKTKVCDCEEKLKHIAHAKISCDAATKSITRQGDIWIGNISDCVVYTICPLDYCNTAQVSFSLTDPDPQCALNRTGMLCGRCRDGLSLALGSNNCIQCPQFSYLALIIPFAAAGFGLVALLMVLNLTVSIGTINGLIFYTSIVKISESTGIFFPNGSIPVLSQFIAWLNLDLGIDTCFYYGMTAYAKVWLQFVFPLYIWFIIATIIVLCRYSTWLSNKIGGNVVQVLATLILLSFTKIFRTVVLAIRFTTLSCIDSNERIVNNFVWYMDGNIQYLSRWHVTLMAAAVLFLLLAVPFTLALLFDAVIEKYLTRIRFFRKQWIKFKPFVDAYHGPYKDNCRFWTGLLLLVRMSFILVVSLQLNTFGTLIFITTGTTVLLSLMVSLEGVYQKKYLNNLECLSYLNLGILSALATVYQNNENQKQMVSIISVSAALVLFCGILLFHVFLRFRRTKRLKKMLKKFGRNASEESERLLEDEGGTVEQLVEPTTSEVCLRRESLIYSRIMPPANSY